MRSPSAEPAAGAAPSRLKQLGLACVFFFAGLAHEWRNPLQCQCLHTRATTAWRAPQRKQV